MWQKLHGKKCRVLAMASTQHAYWVEFEDGTRKIVPRRSLKKVR